MNHKGLIGYRVGYMYIVIGFWKYIVLVQAKKYINEIDKLTSFILYLVGFSFALTFI